MQLCLCVCVDIIIRKREKSEIYCTATIFLMSIFIMWLTITGIPRYSALHLALFHYSTLAFFYSHGLAVFHS
jgi:hypothetical protein